ncbi:MAG: hypothetical protein IGS03_00970 [Candidatus Sericytochromatia bacterium]|nr:hypothetical protein [Candidatus Sericytochromatia bacterium]
MPLTWNQLGKASPEGDYSLLQGQNPTAAELQLLNTWLEHFMRSAQRRWLLWLPERQWLLLLKREAWLDSAGRPVGALYWCQMPAATAAEGLALLHSLSRAEVLPPEQLSPRALPGSPLQPERLAACSAYWLQNAGLLCLRDSEQGASLLAALAPWLPDWLLWLQPDSEIPQVPEGRGLLLGSVLDWPQTTALPPAENLRQAWLQSWQNGSPWPLQGLNCLTASEASWLQAARTGAPPPPVPQWRPDEWRQLLPHLPRLHLLQSLSHAGEMPECPHRSQLLQQLCQHPALSPPEQAWFRCLLLSCAPLPPTPQWSSAEMQLLWPLLDIRRDILRQIFARTATDPDDPPLIAAVQAAVAEAHWLPLPSPPAAAQALHADWVRALRRLPGWHAFGEAVPHD